MHNLHKFWRLPRLEKILLIESLLLLPLTALTMRALGFRRWKSILMTMSRIVERDSAIKEKFDFLKALPTAEMVKVAARHGIYHANCLDQSLVLWWLLARQGIESDLRFGARKDDGFEAHAWVEVEGVPVNESRDVRQRFSQFAYAVSTVEADQ
jgi:Transglutaminase-like superfamily